MFLMVGGKDLSAFIFLSNIFRYSSYSFDMQSPRILLSISPFLINCLSFRFSSLSIYQTLHLRSKLSSSFFVRCLSPEDSHSVLLFKSIKLVALDYHQLLSRLLKNTVALLRLLPAISYSSSFIFNLFLTFSLIFFKTPLRRMALTGYLLMIGQFSLYFCSMQVEIGSMLSVDFSIYSSFSSIQIVL